MENGRGRATFHSLSFTLHSLIRTTSLMSTSNLFKGAVAGLVAGAVGSWVKSQAEPLLQTVAEDFFPPTHAEKERPGADVSGHPERMPPAKLAQEMTDETLSRDEKLAAQDGIHYAFGTSAGMVYGLLAEVTPLGSALGLPAAAALWAGTHGTTLPALGLQADPDALPTSAHVWEIGSHLVYGLTVDLVRRAVRAAL